MKDKIDILNKILSIQIRYTKPLLKKDDKDYIIEDYENLVFKMKNLIDELYSRIDKANELLKGIRIYGMRSGKTLISDFLNDLSKALDGDDK